MADDGEIVLNFNNSLIRKSDVKLLQGKHWINDIIIGFCFEYFEKEQFNHSADKLAFISPNVTQFILLANGEELAVQLAPLGLPDRQYVFLAINDNLSFDEAGGSHWSLLVYVRSKQEFQHYDPLNGSNKHIAKQLAYKLQPHVHAPMGRMKIIEMDGPQQKNGYDCGVFVIAMAEHLCREFCEHYSISINDMVTSESVVKKRQQLHDLIYQVAKEFAV
ncbi:hypothetical protein ScPMuIL_007855 [Solemya velum]